MWLIYFIDFFLVSFIHMLNSQHMQKDNIPLNTLVKIPIMYGYLVLWQVIFHYFKSKKGKIPELKA